MTLTFRFGHAITFTPDKDRVVGFASTQRNGAPRGRIQQEIPQTSRPSGGCFSLCEQDRYDIRCQTVTPACRHDFSDEAVELHYGTTAESASGFREQKLREAKFGAVHFGRQTRHGEKTIIFAT